MAKSATVRAQVEPELKAAAENVFNQLGISTTQAITLFYEQVKQSGGLPFEARIPNRTTRRTLKNTDEGKDLVRCEDATEMFDRLGL